MPEIQTLTTLAEAIRRSLDHHEEVLFAYLHGSSVADPNLPGADIDIAVYLKPSTLKDYIRKETELTSLLISQLRTDRIDLRLLNVLPLVLQYHILRDGILLFSRDDAERVDFETRVMMRFFDLRPYLEEYRQMLLQRIKGAE